MTAPIDPSQLRVGDRIWHHKTHAGSGTYVVREVVALRGGAWSVRVNGVSRSGTVFKASCLYKAGECVELVERGEG